MPGIVRSRAAATSASTSWPEPTSPPSLTQGVERLSGKRSALVGSFRADDDRYTYTCSPNC